MAAMNSFITRNGADFSMTVEIPVEIPVKIVNIPWRNNNLTTVETEPPLSEQAELVIGVYLLVIGMFTLQFSHTHFLCVSLCICACVCVCVCVVGGIGTHVLLYPCLNQSVFELSQPISNILLIKHAPFQIHLMSWRCSPSYTQCVSFRGLNTKRCSPSHTQALNTKRCSPSHTQCVSFRGTGLKH